MSGSENKFRYHEKQWLPCQIDGDRFQDASVGDFPSQGLGAAMFAFAVKAFSLRAETWSGGCTLFADDRHAANQLFQPVQCFLPVFLLLPVLPGLDDDHALFVNALILQ